MEMLGSTFTANLFRGSGKTITTESISGLNHVGVHSITAPFLHQEHEQSFGSRGHTE